MKKEQWSLRSANPTLLAGEQLVDSWARFTESRRNPHLFAPNFRDDSTTANMSKEWKPTENIWEFTHRNSRCSKKKEFSEIAAQLHPGRSQMVRQWAETKYRTKATGVNASNSEKKKKHLFKIIYPHIHIEPAIFWGALALNVVYYDDLVRASGWKTWFNMLQPCGGVLQYWYPQLAGWDFFSIKFGWFEGYRGSHLLWHMGWPHYSPFSDTPCVCHL